MNVQCSLRLLITAAFLAFVVPRAAMAVDDNKGAAGGTANAEPTKESPRGKSSLDDELLKDLGPDAVPGEAGSANPAKDADADPLDRELLKGLSDGEDFGSPDEQSPLARLNKEMREVEGLMARGRSGGETRRLQSQIISELEDLIRQAQKPPQGGSSSSSGDKSGKGAQQTANRRRVPQPGKRSGEGQTAGDAAARQSSKRTREETAKKPDMADMRELLKGVWGQLPERQREQMLQSYEEQFLPKYEQMIADYFRSIAEERER